MDRLSATLFPQTGDGHDGQISNHPCTTSNELLKEAIQEAVQSSMAGLADTLRPLLARLRSHSSSRHSTAFSRRRSRRNRKTPGSSSSGLSSTSRSRSRSPHRHGKERASRSSSATGSSSIVSRSQTLPRLLPVGEKGSGNSPCHHQLSPITFPKISGGSVGVCCHNSLYTYDKCCDRVNKIIEMQQAWN